MFMLRLNVVVMLMLPFQFVQLKIESMPLLMLTPSTPSMMMTNLTETVALASWFQNNFEASDDLSTLLALPTFGAV